jgi:hypothetical protein
VRIGFPARDRNLLAQIPVAQNLGARTSLKAAALALALRSLSVSGGSRESLKRGRFATAALAFHLRPLVTR